MTRPSDFLETVLRQGLVSFPHARAEVSLRHFPKCSECTLASGLTELHSPLQNRLWRNGGSPRSPGAVRLASRQRCLLLHCCSWQYGQLWPWRWETWSDGGSPYRLFPNLYVTGRVAPMEELVVIDGQGHVEDRLMMFRGVD